MQEDVPAGQGRRERKDRASAASTESTVGASADTPSMPSASSTEAPSQEQPSASDADEGGVIRWEEQWKNIQQKGLLSMKRLLAHGERDFTRLERHKDSLHAAIDDSRKELVTAARVPSASLGRVKDIFDGLQSFVMTSASEQSTADVHLERASKADALEVLRKQLMTDFEQLLQETIAKITLDRNTKVAAAEAKAHEEKRKYDDLVSRTSAAVELLQEAEVKVINSEAAKAKAVAEVTQSQAADEHRRQAWKEAVTQTLRECTLKAPNEEKAPTGKRRSPPQRGKPEQKRERTAVEVIRQRLEKLSSPGEQLKALISAYEQAKKEEEEKSVEVAREAAEQLVNAQMAAEETAAHVEEGYSKKIAEVTAQWRTEETAHKGLQAQIQKLTLDLSQANTVAREEARQEIKQLDIDHEALKRKVAALTVHLEEKTEKLEKLQEEKKVGEEQTRIEAAALTMLLQKEKARHARTVGELNDSRAAMPRRGGYYFAAAPPKSPTHASRIRHAASLADLHEALGGGENSRPSSPLSPFWDGERRPGSPLSPMSPVGSRGGSPPPGVTTQLAHRTNAYGTSRSAPAFRTSPATAEGGEPSPASRKQQMAVEQVVASDQATAADGSLPPTADLERAGRRMPVQSMDLIKKAPKLKVAAKPKGLPQDSDRIPRGVPQPSDRGKLRGASQESNRSQLRGKPQESDRMRARPMPTIPQESDRNKARAGDSRSGTDREHRRATY